MYYIITPKSDDEGNMLSFTYKKDHRGRSFVQGEKFTDDPDAPIWEQHPTVPIRLEVELGCEDAPLPSFLREPIPIMTKELLSTIKAAGVDNIDTYDAELYYADGSLASKDYVVFNIIGAIAAADMDISKYDPDQPDKMTSMSFDALAINEHKVNGLLMFRLAENITTIVIHRVIKEAIEVSGIPLIRIMGTRSAAIL